MFEELVVKGEIVQFVSNGKAGMESDGAAYCILNLQSRILVDHEQKRLSARKEIFNKANSCYGFTSSLRLRWIITS